MRVYEWSLKSETVADLELPARALYLLTAPSTPEAARNEILERAEAGEKITGAAVTEAVAKAKGKDGATGNGTPKDDLAIPAFLQRPAASETSTSRTTGTREIPVEDRKREYEAFDAENDADQADARGGGAPMDGQGGHAAPVPPVPAKSPSNLLAAAWDAAPPEDQAVLRARILDELLADADATRAFLDRLGVDGMRLAMSPEFGEQLRAALPSHKKSGSKRAVETGRKSGKPIFELRQCAATA